MSIYKVADLFQGKLSLASSKLSEDLRKIMVAASDLVKNYDVYDDAHNAAQNLSDKAYQYWKMSTNPTQTIPSATVAGWLQSLTNAVANAAKVATDPKGAAKIRLLNSIIPSVQPMDIAPEGVGSTYQQKPPAQEENEGDVEQTYTPGADDPVSYNVPEAEISEETSAPTSPPAEKDWNLNPNWKYKPKVW